MISMFAYYDTAFKGTAEYVGFPSSTSSGVALAPTSLIGLSSTSPNKKIAIEFIYFILSDHCQTEKTLPGLPIVINSLESRMDYWASEYEEFHKPLSAFYDGASVEIRGSISAETAKSHLYDAINAADTLAIFDNNILQLIANECQPFFNGVIPARQTAERIQSKIQLYIAEKS